MKFILTVLTLHTIVKWVSSKAQKKEKIVIADNVAHPAETQLR